MPSDWLIANRSWSCNSGKQPWGEEPPETTNQSDDVGQVEKCVAPGMAATSLSLVGALTFALADLEVHSETEFRLCGSVVNPWARRLSAKLSSKIREEQLRASKPGVEQKSRLVVTFALVDEADVPSDLPSHLMVCKASSLFRGGGATISVVGREAGAPVYGRALGIGIQNYAGDNRLKNSLHDATDVAARLRDIGFDVSLVTDETVEAGLVSQLEMIDAMDRFVKSVDKNTVAVFAFMGHGQEKNGMHYLMPQEMPKPKYLQQRAIGQKETLDQTEAKSPVLTMAILDCCRERVTGARGESCTKGLRGLAGPAGSLVMYATGEGGCAQDWSSAGSRNNVFTESLLEHLGTPGLDLDKMRRNVTKSVVQKTEGAQRPESYDTTEETFILVAGPNSDDRAVEIAQLSDDTPVPTEIVRPTTLLPVVQQGHPHIFISYRRTHFELADRTRRQLQTYMRCWRGASARSPRALRTSRRRRLWLGFRSAAP